MIIYSNPLFLADGAVSVGASSPSGCTSTRWEMNSASFASTNSFDPNYIHHAVCMWFIDGLPEAKTVPLFTFLPCLMEHIAPTVMSLCCGEVMLLPLTIDTVSSSFQRIRWYSSTFRTQAVVLKRSCGTKKRLTCFL